MIAVRVLGGLGNQLFQLAAAMHLRDTTGQRVVLDRSWYRSSSSHDTPREFALTGFTDNIRIVSIPNSLHALARRFGPPHYVTERQPGDVILGNLVSRTWLLHGYFQNSIYPISSIDSLRRAFTAAIPDAFENDTARPYIAVHSRLGDYLTNQHTSSAHGVTDPADLLRNAAVLGRRLGGVPLRIFTDSPKAFVEIVGSRLPSDATFSEAKDPWRVISEMSRGAAIVMSNSSLSWWAAFTATRLRGSALPVYFPTPWFAQSSIADEILKLDDWTDMPRLIIAP